MQNFPKVAQFFGTKIAERGLAYFQQGKVRQLENHKEKRWYAEIIGTYPYYASLTLSKNFGIASYECNCPYGGRCKHLAALYFAALQALNYQVEPSYPLEIKESDDERLLSELRDHFNRYGKGCDYWQVKEAYETFSGFLSDEPMCDSEDMEFKLLHTFYTRMNTLILKSDDDGLLGELMDECVIKQGELYQQTQNLSLKTKIEKAWFKMLNDEKHWIALDVTIMPKLWLAAMCNSGRAKTALAWVLEHLAKEDEYGKSAWLIRQYEVLCYIDEQQAVEFLLKNTHIDQLRQFAVERYFQAGQDKLAEKLLLDGVKNASSDTQRLVWITQLLTLSEKREDQQKIAEYAKELALFSDYSHIQSDYFKLWQKQFSTEQWQNEIKYALKQDVLIQNETKQAHFLALTQQLDLLENLLLQSQDNKLQMDFIHYLSAEKQRQVAKSTLLILENKIAKLTARKYYAYWVKEVNNLLKKFPDLMCEVTLMTDRVREKYKTRPALIEEMQALLVQC